MVRSARSTSEPGATSARRTDGAIHTAAKAGAPRASPCRPLHVGHDVVRIYAVRPEKYGSDDERTRRASVRPPCPARATIVTQKIAPLPTRPGTAGGEKIPTSPRRASWPAANWHGMSFEGSISVRQPHRLPSPIATTTSLAEICVSRRRPEERVAERDVARRRLGALAPDQRTGPGLLGAGFSYREIGRLCGWTYTKVNRCVTEGRAGLRAVPLHSEERC